MKKEIFEKLFKEYDPLQRKEELYQLVNLIEFFKPRIILEIGVHKGGSLKFWETILPKNGLVIGINLQDVVKWDYRKSKKVEMIEGNSHDLKTLRKVKKILGERKVDFLFIDASHHYKNAKLDFEMYSPLVRERGIIVFHDIRNPEGIKEEERVTVNKLFNKLKEKYKWLEIIVPSSWEGPDGEGVIFKEKL